MSGAALVTARPTLYRTFTVVAFAAVTLGHPQGAIADYVVSDRFVSVSTNQEWLYDAIEAEVEKGAEAVTLDLLTSLGKTLVDSYAPELTSLLFGGESELELHTKRIIDAVEAGNQDLIQRHQELIDEIMTQYRVNVEAIIRGSTDSVQSWLAAQSRLQRINTRDVMRDVSRDLRNVRNAIELYIEAEATSRIGFRRLQLVELHIVAARMEILADLYYYSTSALLTEFQRSGEASFELWFDALSEEERTLIAENVPQSASTADTVHGAVLSFYNNLSRSRIIDMFLEDTITPVVSYGETFKRPSGEFDNPASVTNRANWGIPEGAESLPILDGVRWYYYANIPQSPPGWGTGCVEGYAFDDLAARGQLPWYEEAGAPEASECNRFWFVDPSLNTSSWPDEHVLASFDGYSVWFADAQEAQDLHRRLLRGDILRAIYGPISLTLDEMHLDSVGWTRPKNAWDRILDGYEEDVSMLGFASSLTDAVGWADLRDAKAELAAWGGERRWLGLPDWDRAMTALVEEGPGARAALELLGSAKSSIDWLGYAGREAPFSLTADEIRFALIGPGSIRARRSAGVGDDVLRRELEAKFRNDAAAKRVAVIR